jgi:hypothetical protein
MAPDPKLLYYVKNMLADRPPGRCVMRSAVGGGCGWHRVALAGYDLLFVRDGWDGGWIGWSPRWVACISTDRPID